MSIANCCSGLPRIPAVYRTQRPIASTYMAFFRTLLEMAMPDGFDADILIAYLCGRVPVFYGPSDPNS